MPGRRRINALLQQLWLGTAIFVRLMKQSNPLIPRSSLLIKHYKEFIDELMPKMQPRHYVCLKKTPFHPYLDIPLIISQRNVLLELVNRYDKRSGSFIIGGNKCRFTVEWVAQHMWLPNAEECLNMISRGQSRIWDFYIDPSLGDKENIRDHVENWLLVLVEETGRINEEDFVKLLVWYILSHVIVPQTAQQMTRWAAKYCDDLHTIGNHDWARAVHKEIMDSVAKLSDSVTKIKDGKRKTGGYMRGNDSILEIWFYQLVGWKRQKFKRDKPPVLSWDLSGAPRHPTVVKIFNDFQQASQLLEEEHSQRKRRGTIESKHPTKRPRHGEKVEETTFWKKKYEEREEEIRSERIQFQLRELKLKNEIKMLKKKLLKLSSMEENNKDEIFAQYKEDEKENEDHVEQEGKKDEPEADTEQEGEDNLEADNWYISPHDNTLDTDDILNAKCDVESDNKMESTPQEIRIPSPNLKSKCESTNLKTRVQRRRKKPGPLVRSPFIGVYVDKARKKSLESWIQEKADEERLHGKDVSKQLPTIDVTSFNANNFSGSEALLNEEIQLIESFLKNGLVSSTYVCQGGNANLLTKDWCALLNGDCICVDVIDVFVDLLRRDPNTDNKHFYIVRPWIWNFMTKSQNLGKGELVDIDSDIFDVSKEMFHTMKHIIFPLISSNHWHVLVLDVDNKSFKHYSSLGDGSLKSPYAIDARGFVRWLGIYINKKVGVEGIGSHGVEECTVHQQDNGYDCGVFVLEYLRCIVEGKALDVKQSDIKVLRAKYAALILQEGERRMQIKGK